MSILNQSLRYPIHLARLPVRAFTAVSLSEPAKIRTFWPSLQTFSLRYILAFPGLLTHSSSSLVSSCFTMSPRPPGSFGPPRITINFSFLFASNSARYCLFVWHRFVLQELKPILRQSISILIGNNGQAQLLAHRLKGE